MTHKERVYAALNHEQPDKTPYCVGLTYRAHEAMVAHYGDASYQSLIDNCFHDVGPAKGPKDMWLDDNIWQDEFGVQWDRSIDRDIGNVCNCLIPERSLENLELPDPVSPEAWQGFDAAVEAGRDKFVLFHKGFSLFERAWTLRGMAALFEDMLEAPDFVDALLDAICDFNVAATARALENPGVDGVHFGDDWGSQRGLLMGPKLWHRFIQPRLKRMYAVAKDCGKYVTIHSCGKVQELFPALIEIGLDCFNPFQPEVMDPYEMKAQFGGRLSFWGGISTQKLLPYGTPDEVRAEIRRLIAEVGKSGGYILAPAHATPGDAKPENVMAMLETINDQ